MFKVILVQALVTVLRCTVTDLEMDCHQAVSKILQYAYERGNFCMEHKHASRLALCAVCNPKLVSEPLTIIMDTSKR